MSFAIKLYFPTIKVFSLFSYYKQFGAHPKNLRKNVGNQIAIENYDGLEVA